MRRLLIVIALLFAHTAVAGDYEDGLAAYERKDYATAFSKFRSAAQQGNPKAQYNIGIMYNDGHGVKYDFTEAVRWWMLAAKQDLPEAQYNLGYMFSKGLGVAQDYQEAVRWYRLAAKQGMVKAQSSLGYKYGKGQGVILDLIRAHMWFNIAAISGDVQSVENRNKVERQLSPQQVEQAQRMARECIASKFKKCD